MYLRTARRKNEDGSVVEYFQLAHNERHPVTRKPVAKIIHNFGRTDQLDRERLVRLCRSIAMIVMLEKGSDGQLAGKKEIDLKLRGMLIRIQVVLITLNNLVLRARMRYLFSRP